MANWLLISYLVPAQPSALRVAAWRALRQRGAVLLGPGLYALPDTQVHRDAIAELSARIGDGGGAAIAMTAGALTDGDDRALRAKFDAAREDEYGQVAKSARKLALHIAREEESGDFRFAEVESLEEELDKVRRQFERVRARDGGTEHAEQRDVARAAIHAAETRLQRYLDRAYHEDHGE